MSFVFVFAAGCGGDSPQTDKNGNGGHDDKDHDDDGEETDNPPVVDVNQKAFYNLPYGESDMQKLDIFLPVKVKDLSKAIPVFVLIHGGGWAAGDKSDFYYFAEAINPNGYAAITINYRLTGSGAKYLDMLDDIGAALTYIKEYGAQYKLKTDKIALAGSSAGGHLALLYSYKMRTLSPIPISMVISMVGPTDFTDPAYYEEDKLTDRLNIMEALTGIRATEEEIRTNNLPAAYKDASPLTHVDNQFPPTLLAYGMKDELVPYTNATRLYNKLQSYNRPYSNYLVTFVNSGHGLDNDADKLEESMSVLAQAATFYLPL